MKLFVRQTVQLLLGLVLSCVAAEVLLRVLAPYSPQLRFFSSNPYQRQYLENIVSPSDITRLFCCQHPNGVINGFTANSRGYFTPELPYAKPPTTKRLVLIGDSQAVGVVPFEENFLRLTEKRILESTMSAFQAVNLGAIGFGPLMEEKVLAIEGMKYAPDIVVYAFFVGNDFYDDIVYRDRYMQAKPRIPLWVYQSRLFSFLRNSFRFHAYTIRDWLSRRRSAPASEATNSATIAAQSFTPEEYLYLERERAGILVQGHPLYDNLSAVKASILRMKNIAERGGATFMVVIIPDEFQVNKTLLKQITEISMQESNGQVREKMAQYLYRSNTKGNRSEIPAYDPLLPQKILSEFFLSENIRYLDPLPVWGSAENGADYYVPRNTHLSPYGNQKLADLLAPAIMEILHSR
jgi:hypothetical protein